MVIQEAAEMYLKTILNLQNNIGAVRAIDIAKEMGYSKPTVSEQMKKFKTNGLIEINVHGHISLTDKGLDIAQKVLNRNHVLIEALKKIGVSDEIAYKAACRIEHYISQETYEAMKKYFTLPEENA